MCSVLLPNFIIRNTVKNCGYPLCERQHKHTIACLFTPKIDRVEENKVKTQRTEAERMNLQQKMSILMREPSQRTRSNSNAVLFIHHLVIFTFCFNVTNTKPISLLFFSVVWSQVNTICTHDSLSLKHILSQRMQTQNTNNLMYDIVKLVLFVTKMSDDRK